MTGIDPRQPEPDPAEVAVERRRVLRAGIVVFGGLAAIFLWSCAFPAWPGFALLYVNGGLTRTMATRGIERLGYDWAVHCNIPAACTARARLLCNDGEPASISDLPGGFHAIDPRRRRGLHLERGIAVRCDVPE